MESGSKTGSLIREAAPYLRLDDSYSFAAGLCGFLFAKIDYDGETGGTMSLDQPPEVGPDGKVNWKSFGGVGYVFLINIHTQSARCCHGIAEGEEIRDLPIGELAHRLEQ